MEDYSGAGQHMLCRGNICHSLMELQRTGGLIQGASLDDYIGDAYVRLVFNAQASTLRLVSLRLLDLRALLCTDKVSEEVSALIWTHPGCN